MLAGGAISNGTSAVVNLYLYGCLYFDVRFKRIWQKGDYFSPRRKKRLDTPCSTLVAREQN
jgi:hypothetical protein